MKNSTDPSSTPRTVAPLVQRTTKNQINCYNCTKKDTCSEFRSGADKKVNNLSLEIYFETVAMGCADFKPETTGNE